MGTLYIVATPIGNLEDLSKRADRILRDASVVIAEDTRHTGLLLQKLGINHKRMLSMYDEVEEQKVPEIIDILRRGENCALVSDAGTPLVADPGYKLIRHCIRSDIPIVPIPGPSAFLAILTASGMPPDRFAFLGYFPQKEKKRRELANDIRRSREEKFISTFIFYESPHRLISTLKTIRELLGDVPVVVGRELTKIHEEVFRGSIQEALTHFSNPKGEFVIVL